MGSGSFLEALGAEEHMSEKQGVGSVFIKEWEPALCPALFQKIENAPELQTSSRPMAAGHAWHWDPLSLCLPLPPCLQLLQ